MPRVHDKYNKYCPQNWIAPFDEANCVCPPTIQHEEGCKKCDCICHEKMVLCPRKDDFCNIHDCKPCTCSRQGEPKVDMSCPCGCGMFMIEKHYSCFHGQECGESDCPHQKKQDWEAWFDEKFPIAIDYPPFPNKVQETGVFFEIEIEQRTNRAKAKHEAIKDFIRKEKELSKEEGRREGYEDGKALRGKEWKQDIEEVRLEVIGAVEDYVRRYYVLHKNDGKPLIEKADILALLDSLKNNSKL